MARIRKDHPRLFFNADTWPAVKERALTACKDHFAEVKRHADGPWADEGGEWAVIERPPARPGSSVDVRDWGKQLMAAALAHRVEPSPQRLQRIKDMLWASLDYYHACYAAGQDVSWYSTSRIGWLCAFDWTWRELTPNERRELGASMLRHVDDALHKPNIRRRNLAGFQSGYYGADNIAFFAGVVFLNEGIDDARAWMCLKTGYNEYQKLLPYRAKLAGDDGGGASPTLGYTLAASGRAEWN
ncbi:MAG: hypothetical protein FJ272_14870, partial [Planctomycetes bacterium]|nr:hypothetical protein [Planctomycetota bacterium]